MLVKALSILLLQSHEMYKINMCNILRISYDCTYTFKHNVLGAQKSHPFIKTKQQYILGGVDDSLAGIDRLPDDASTSENIGPPAKRYKLCKTIYRLPKCDLKIIS